MNKFYALDVETANADMASICQIGLAEFQGNKLVNQWVSLINPEDYFDPFNISIHGISSSMVNSSPKFPDIYNRLKDICKADEKAVVITYTSFDQTSIKRASQKHKMTEFNVQWLDVARVVRRQWEEFRQSGYGLANVAKKLGIDYKPHDALEDARTAGEIFIQAVEQSGLSLETWLEKAYTKTLSGNGKYAQEGNPEGPLNGETIVFTGSLSSPRQEAAKLAATAGCNVCDGVNKNTTLLVVGIQNRDKLAGYEKSSKHRKAEQLIEKGQNIRIISENDFLEMI